ncbi:MAG: type I-E CRISPR-associated endoribonuclease Cas2e [Myxococcales bacterium]
MSMTIVVPRNVPDRFRGFLASVMLEVASGVYVNPHMTKGVRDRVISVLNGWSCLLPPDSNLSLFWRESTAPGGLGMANIGTVRFDLQDLDGLWVDRRELTKEELKSLAGPSDTPTSLPDK